MFKPIKLSSLLNNCKFDILELTTKKDSPIQFKDFKFLRNPKTNKSYSSSTITAKLKELTKEKLIEPIIIKNKSPIQYGYTSTEKAKKALELIKETEEKYKKL